MIGDPLIKDYHARSHIAMDDPAAVRCWTKRLHVTNDELQRAVEKVGNSVVAIRKQLGVVEAR